MASAIDRLVDQAQAQADKAPAPAPLDTTAGTDLVPQDSGVPSVYGAGATLPSLADAARNARTPVDFYLQVMKDGSGLKIGKDMGYPIDEFRGVVDMTAVKTNFVIRVDNGNGQQAKYVKSLDMKKTTAGVPLDAAIKQVRLPGGQVKDPYVGYMIPVVLTEDVVDAKKGSTFVAKAGQTVMVETSYSAGMDFEGFLAKLAKVGLLEETALQVVVRNNPISNRGGITYGSVEFDIAE